MSQIKPDVRLETVTVGDTSYQIAVTVTGARHNTSPAWFLGFAELGKAKKRIDLYKVEGNHWFVLPDDASGSWTPPGVKASTASKASKASADDRAAEKAAELAKAKREAARKKTVAQGQQLAADIVGKEKAKVKPPTLTVRVTALEAALEAANDRIDYLESLLEANGLGVSSATLSHLEAGDEVNEVEPEASEEPAAPAKLSKAEKRRLARIKDHDSKNCTCSNHDVGCPAVREFGATRWPKAKKEAKS